MADTCNTEQREDDAFHPWGGSFLTPKTPEGARIIQLLFGGLALGAAPLTPWAALQFPQFRIAILWLWAVVPSVWFWYEYTYLYPELKKANHALTLEEFKYGQELGRYIWAGVLAVLIALEVAKGQVSPLLDNPTTHSPGAIAVGTAADEKDDAGENQSP